MARKRIAGKKVESLEFLIRKRGKNDDHLGVMLSEIPALFCAVGKDGNVQLASKHYTLLAGVVDQLESIESELELYPEVVRSRVKKLIEKHHLELASLQEGDLSALSECEQSWNLKLKHKDGSQHLYQLKRFYVYDSASGFIAYTIGIDVTDNRLAEQALRDRKSRVDYSTFHDSLTGLANRSLFYDRLHKSLSRARRNKSNLAILLVGLNSYKQVCSKYGYDLGDAYLKCCATKLREELRDTDTICRLGEDEFAIALENVQLTENIEGVANKLLTTLSEPVLIGNHKFDSRANIGISLFPEDGGSIDQLLKNADRAMYQAKQRADCVYQFFSSNLQDSTINYLLLENDLRQAIENEELTVFFQPQVALHNGRIVGLEALVRWRHEERGLLNPFHFIPLAEETGLIEPLGEWVIRFACRKFRSWLDRGFNFGKVAVNVSTRQLMQESFDRTIQDLLFETGLASHYLELEITESAAMENAAKTTDILKRLSAMGLSLSIDDFGTGYSSLAYLKRFPIQKLKIDRSFVSDIDGNGSDSIIAKSIIDLAHNMSLNVIAEGVEHATQVDWLSKRGCDQIQGFYYSKPLSESELLLLVNRDEVCEMDGAGIRFHIEEIVPE